MIIGAEWLERSYSCEAVIMGNPNAFFIVAQERVHFVVGKAGIVISDLLCFTGSRVDEDHTAAKCCEADERFVYPGAAYKYVTMNIVDVF